MTLSLKMRYRSLSSAIGVGMSASSHLELASMFMISEAGPDAYSRMPMKLAATNTPPVHPENPSKPTPTPQKVVCVGVKGIYVYETRLQLDDNIFFSLKQFQLFHVEHPKVNQIHSAVHDKD